ncbi:membrane protein [Streptomyces sp. RSD-27]|nr:membrane protein [Streptomyces sp. RSD-27]
MTFRNEDLPALFHHTDQAAVSRQRESTQATRAQLALLVVAAGAAALPSGPEAGGLHVFAALGALAYAGVLAVGVRATRRRARPQWQLNRSAAEFIKSLAWRYAVHGAPFGSEVAGPEGVYRARLEKGLDELRKMGWRDPRTAGLLPEGGEITGAMQRLRGLEYQVRRETYVRDRLIEQRTWYQRRAEGSRRATALWSWTIVLLTCLGLLFALFGAFGSGPGASAAAGLTSAAAAAAIAWNEVRRHHPLIEAHTLIEQDLSAMMVVMQTTITESQWPSAVYETERYVSPQHTDWLARHSS